MSEIRLSRMKRSVLKCMLCFLLVFALSGCGISERIVRGRAEDYFTSINYSKYKTDEVMSYIPCLMPVMLIDFPLSLAADIVCLPFEVVINLHRNYRKNVDRQFWEMYFANGQSLSTPDEGRRHLSDRIVILRHLEKPLPKQQLIDLIQIGFASDVAKNQKLDRELFERCLGKQDAIPDVIENPGVTSQMLHEIMLSPQIKLTKKALTALAKSNKTPQADLELLYPSDSDQVIINLTRNPNTSDELLCRIFADPKSNEYKKRDISINMASRASVPAEIQEFILSYNDYDNTAKARLIQNKAILPEIRSALIQPKLISEFCRQKLLSREEVRQLLDEAPADLRAIMENDKEIISYIGNAKK